MNLRLFFKDEWERFGARAMESWVTALLSVGVLTGLGALLRSYLIFKVSIWSLTADDAGRKHALALLRALKFQFRATPEPPVEPSKNELPPAGPSDPPPTGPVDDATAGP